MGIHVEALRRTKLFLATPPNPVPINPLAQFVDTLGWVSGVLQVRVYDVNFVIPLQSLGGGGARVAVYNTSVSQEDPSVTLIETAPLTFVQFDYSLNTSGTPVLLTSRIPGRMSRYVSVQLSTLLLDGATSTSGDITVGVDLIGRDA